GAPRSPHRVAEPAARPRWLRSGGPRHGGRAAPRRRLPAGARPALAARARRPAPPRPPARGRGRRRAQRAPRAVGAPCARGGGRAGGGMELEGEYLFEAKVPEVWSALFDPVILAAVMPGCEKLELVDGHYVGDIKVKVGPIQGKFTGKVDLQDKVEPQSYTMI